MSKTYNPYNQMLEVLEKAAAMLDYQPNDIVRLKYPERELKVSIPVEMDDGTVKVFEGYRVQHSSSRGPCKGGLRYHQDVDIDEVKALVRLDELQVRGRQHPLRRRQRCDQGRSEGTVQERTETADPALHGDDPADDRTGKGYSGAGRQHQCRDHGLDHGYLQHVQRLYSPGRRHRQADRHRRFAGTERSDRPRRHAGHPRDPAPAGHADDRYHGRHPGHGQCRRHRAQLLHQEGCQIVAVSDVSGGLYKPTGLNIPEISAFLADPGQST